jgi:pyruvate kinase
VPIVFDLSGPKIRTGRLPDGGRMLARGERIVLAPEGEARAGEIPVSYARLARCVEAGDRILVDDGLFEWRVRAVVGRRVLAQVRTPGLLKDHKGINLPGVRLKIDSLTDKDRRDAALAVARQVDWVAQSFVRSAADVRRMKSLLGSIGGAIPVIAKIEKPEALEDIDNILDVADALMVARGDLGVEIEPQKVPEVQKHLIARANAAEKPVIVATQMLESMIEHPRPTRAEASDVANAIFDGADAVMLSAETASGRYPVASVAMMAAIASEAERSPYAGAPLSSGAERPGVAHAVARAAGEIAREVSASGIVCFTESGKTAVLLSKVVRELPILAFSRTVATCRRISFSRGVRAAVLPMPDDTDAMIAQAKAALRASRFLRRGSRVVIVSGPARVPGATNMIRVEEL